MPCLKRDCAGFSLLEVVLAMGLFSMGMLSAVQMADAVIRTNQAARHRTTALLLARNKMETVRALAYDEILGFAEGNLGERGRFQRRVDVKTHGSPAFKLITVSVMWSGRMSRQVVLISIVAAPG